MAKMEMRTCALEECTIEFEAEARKTQRFCTKAHANANRGAQNKMLPVIGSTQTCATEGCSETWIVQGGALRSKRYHNQTCSNRATTEKRIESQIERRVITPRALAVCPCGRTCSTFQQKYCSSDCRKEYGDYKQPNPENNATHKCQNCGQEFTRNKSSTAANMFCSNACARTHTKTRRFYTVEEFDIVFESSYEAFFWGACKIAKIPIDRFDRDHGVAWADGKWYAPDFWIPGLNLAVEIKGYEDPDDAARWAAYRKTQGALVVLTSVELMSIAPADILDLLQN